MIEIKDLCKQFGEKKLFTNFSLQIEDGAFVIFSGESGCGKTTLLNMIGGIEPYQSGSIYVDGMDVSQRKNKQKYYREKVGFLFQNFALVEQMTVRENFNLVRKSCRTEISFEQALEAVGLSGELDTKVYRLSGGEQQRVALARLMIKQCSLILADEPTGALDIKNARMVMDILKQINQMGKTVLMVTHTETFYSYADRIIPIQ